jgi:hypothetical protein
MDSRQGIGFANAKFTYLMQLQVPSTRFWVVVNIGKQRIGSQDSIQAADSCHIQTARAAELSYFCTAGDHIPANSAHEWHLSGYC